MFIEPKVVINGISIELRKFLCQGRKTQGKKFHLVKWAKILEYKAKGGLGISFLRLMNKSLGDNMV